VRRTWRRRAPCRAQQPSARNQPVDRQSLNVEFIKQFRLTLAHEGTTHCDLSMLRARHTKRHMNERNAKKGPEAGAGPDRACCRRCGNFLLNCEVGLSVPGMVVAPKAGQSQTGGSTFGPIKRTKVPLRLAWTFHFLAERQKHGRLKHLWASSSTDSQVHAPLLGLPTTAMFSVLGCVLSSCRCPPPPLLPPRSSPPPHSPPPAPRSSSPRAPPLLSRFPLAPPDANRMGRCFWW